MNMKLDFRTKAWMTVVISFILLFGNLQEMHPFLFWSLVTIPYVMLLSKRQFKKVFGNLFGLLIAFAIEKAAVYYSFSGLLASISLFLSIIIIRLLPGYAMGDYTLLTTTMSDLAASLQRMKLPDVLIIPISVMFRFFYTVKEDYRQIREAMYLQGLVGWTALKHPLRMIEYRFVPLLMCLSRTADDVAISATTRGMSAGKERTTISTTKLRIYDYAIIVIFLVILITNYWS